MAACLNSNTPAPVAGRGVSRAAWVAQQKGRKAVLYVVKVYGNGEAFYKLGITYDLRARFARLKTCYKWRTLARFSSWNAALVFDLEQRLHAEFSGLAYVPALSFGGRTECYSDAEPILAALPSKGTFFLKPVANDI
ncbi:hypothetical protein GCM10023185_29650 [Hymenobacter saemangeumensis]|uniref:Bacteriophage T5 Orf172 DNA-binding domain-containing protein n=1 Tax=Hymenobacter saemangeumensis TaxID=1084522 RepID=A0ABP8ILP0_9BACT